MGKVEMGEKKTQKKKKEDTGSKSSAVKWKRPSRTAGRAAR